jgi:hypothetical protein
LGKISRMSEWSTIIQWHRFSVSCLVNPDPTLGPGFVYLIFLHVNMCDYFHG